MINVDITNMSLAEVLDASEEATVEANTAKSEVEQLEKERMLAVELYIRKEKHAKILRKFMKETLATGDVQKREKIQAKYHAQLQANQTQFESASKKLEESRNSVTEAIANLPAIIQRATADALEQVSSSVEKDEPKPVIFTIEPVEA